MWASDPEIAAIAEYLAISQEQMRRKHIRKVDIRQSLVEVEGSKDCIFLSGAADGVRRCRIYPVRPSQCRTWPFWPDNVHSPARWAAAQLRCPGINRGERHGLDEIEAKRKATGA